MNPSHLRHLKREIYDLVGSLSVEELVSNAPLAAVIEELFKLLVTVSPH